MMRNEKKTQNRFRRILLSPVTTIAMFALAAVLLLGSGIGGARAALNYFSEDYASHVEMDDIGVSLLENDAIVSYRNYKSSGTKGVAGTWSEATGVLLQKMLGEGEVLSVGKKYSEVLSIQNTGTIDQYARVSIYKYWTDAKGEKIALNNDEKLTPTTELSPALIDLHYVNVGGAWIRDDAACTVDQNGERVVLYYSKRLDAGVKSEPFTDSLKIDQMVGRIMDQKIVTEGTHKTITTTYSYDGYQFHLEVTVDAVQDHNAQDAVKSAWGRNVVIDGTSLRLGQ